MLSQTFQSRWFALTLHAGLWLLLVLLVFRLRGPAAPFAETATATTAVQTNLPVAKLAQLFAPAPSRLAAGATNRLSPFATRYFVPAAPPVVAPPTTRKVELTYQGFYQVTESVRRIFLQVDKKMVICPVGDQFVTSLFIATADLQTLTLTNAAGQTNVLKLNTKTTLEVPVK
jgi:hypothetical protein